MDAATLVFGIGTTVLGGGSAAAFVTARAQRRSLPRRDAVEERLARSTDAESANRVLLATIHELKADNDGLRLDNERLRDQLARARGRSQRE